MIMMIIIIIIILLLLLLLFNNNSADDLRINLWHLGAADTCFNLVDIKPNDMEDLSEVTLTNPNPNPKPSEMEDLSEVFYL
jgi:hypothetical protein